MTKNNEFVEFEEKVLKAVQTPEAEPEFVHQLRQKVLDRKVENTPVKVPQKWQFKPAWALVAVLVAVVLLVSTPAGVKALRQLLGYVPGVGLVDSSTQIRVLAEPVSQTRDGVTLTIENVFVFDDRVELFYAVEGIAAENDGSQAVGSVDTLTAYCGGVAFGDVGSHAGNAALRLPDGSILTRDQTVTNPQNAFAMKPVFSASIPENVMQMTLLLDCIPWTRLGAVPQNWEVPFNLVAVPEGEIVGLPVVNVQQTAESVPEMKETPVSENMSEGDSDAISTQDPQQTDSGEVVLPDHQIEITLEEMVPTASNLIFYLSMNMQNPDPSLISIMPDHVYLVDSEGQELQLAPSGPWQPFLHKTGSMFEYVLLGTPAEGPLTIVIEDVILYFTPLYVHPPQAGLEELSFSFDVGDDPQHGQTWDLNKSFEIAGYPFQVQSVKAVVWDDVAEPSYIDGSQGYEDGYQFTILGDPRMQMSVQLDLLSENCGLWVESPTFPEGSQTLYTILCREGFPAGEVGGIIRELAVRVVDSWRISWTP